MRNLSTVREKESQLWAFKNFSNRRALWIEWLAKNWPSVYTPQWTTFWNYYFIIIFTGSYLIYHYSIFKRKSIWDSPLGYSIDWAAGQCYVNHLMDWACKALHILQIFNTPHLYAWLKTLKSHNYTYVGMFFLMTSYKLFIYSTGFRHLCPVASFNCRALKEHKIYSHWTSTFS